MKQSVNNPVPSKERISNHAMREEFKVFNKLKTKLKERENERASDNTSRHGDYKLL